MASRAKKGATGRQENHEDDDVAIVKEIEKKKDGKVKEVKSSTSKGTAEAPRYELRSQKKKEEVSEVEALAVEFTKKAVLDAQVNAEVKTKRPSNLRIRPTETQKEEPEGATGVKAEPRYKLRFSDAKEEEPGVSPEVTVEPTQLRNKQRSKDAEKKEPGASPEVTVEPNKLRSSDAKNKEEHEALVGKAGAKSLLVQESETKKNRNLRSKSLEAANSRPLGPSARNKK